MSIFIIKSQFVHLQDMKPNAALATGILLCLLVNDCNCIYDIGKYLAGWIAEHVVGIKYLPSKYQQNAEIVDEALLDPFDLIQKYGYNGEIHYFKTFDGYVLTAHRIPYGPNGYRKGLPVLLMHGFFSNSAQWVDNRYESLAFILADEGYDVWLGNLRGNPYTSHVNYSRDDEKFWDFSIDQHADLDLTATIDYILSLTGSEKLLYVGYSLGSTIAFALLSTNTTYNKKIAGFVALAPIASLAHSSTLIFLPQFRHYKVIEQGYELDNQPWYHVIGQLNLKVRLQICPSSDPCICEFSLNVMGGYNPRLRNRTRVPIFTAHIASGTSVKNAAHLGQMWKKKEFTRYDYGRIGNLLRYKKTHPEKYDVSAITVPIALYHGANDAVANPIDVTLLSRKIRKLVGKELFPHPLASHSDFVWTLDSKEHVYGNVVHMINRMCAAALK